jgi:hypothetical protein
MQSLSCPDFVILMLASLLCLKTFPICEGIVVGAKFERIGVTLREEYGLPKDVAYHLVSNYGTRGEQFTSVVLR